MKILVVDDELSICELMDEFLSQLGYRVTTATNGKDAISKFEDFRPDVVILDIRMPGISGIDVLRKIRTIDNDTVIVMLSAFGDSHTIQEALQSGANCYLEKPLEFARLTKILNDIHEKKR